MQSDLVVVAHPSPRNYFLILRIDPVRLSLDLDDLEKTFYKLSLEFHPDRNPDRPEAVEMSAYLNEAYRTFRDPWARAAYGASLFGKKSAKSPVPAALAEMYFEMQDSEDPAVLEGFAKELETRAAQQNQELLRLFKNFDEAKEKDRKKIAESLFHLINEHNYLESMRRDLKARK